jgi:hypothetical protein
METYACESIVVFVCRPIYDEHEEEHARWAAEAMNNFLNGEQAAGMPSPARLSWDSWAIE